MSNVHDFISPFDLNNCKSRLSRRTEKTKIFASKYEERIKVDVWDINKYTAGFKVYKAPRSSFQLDISWFRLNVSGKLQRHPDGGTVVVYHATQNPIGMIVEWVVALLIGVLAVMIFHRYLYTSFFSPIAITIFIVATVLSVGFTYLYRQFTRNELIGVVRKSLGDINSI